MIYDIHEYHRQAGRFRVVTLAGNSQEGSCCIQGISADFIIGTLHRKVGPSGHSWGRYIFGALQKQQMDKISAQNNLWDMAPPCGHIEDVYAAAVESLKVQQWTNLIYQPRARMMIVVIYTLFSVWIKTKNIRGASIYSSSISELAEESCTFV